MNQLPAAIQTEIWQYVNGDRKFWKTQYELVIDSLENACDFRHIRLAKKTYDAAWSKCVADSQRAWRQGLGKMIREFRRHLSSIDVPMFPDGLSEWNTHSEHWNKWMESFTEV